MGFRDYSPGLNRFLTRDMYNGALADLNLGSNPWTLSRYTFAGGNPTTLIEHDGHIATCTPDGYSYCPNYSVAEQPTVVQIDDATESGDPVDPAAMAAICLEHPSLISCGGTGPDPSDIEDVLHGTGLGSTITGGGPVEPCEHFDHWACTLIEEFAIAVVLTFLAYSSRGRAGPGKPEPVRLPTSTTWGRPDSLDDHFVRHGADFGARTADEYAAMASEFLQRGVAAGLPTKIDPKTGVIRIYDPATNTFGSYNPNGTTATFFKPDPDLHGYPTNWDYWLAQGGYTP
jgi:hypothetical protein